MELALVLTLEPLSEWLIYLSLKMEVLLLQGFIALNQLVDRIKLITQRRLVFGLLCQLSLVLKGLLDLIVLVRLCSLAHTELVLRSSP